MNIHNDPSPPTICANHCGKVQDASEMESMLTREEQLSDSLSSYTMPRSREIQ